MSLFETFLLSLIEGLTEFLPISSTGHLVLTSYFLNINEVGFVKSFNVIIQCGAIASVLVIYRKDFFSSISFYKKLICAFLPAAIIGLLVKNKIDAILGSLAIVGWTTLIGGVILIWSDSFFAKNETSGKTINELSIKDCIKLGFFQCLAFLPGVSRSGATIIGGLSLGLKRKDAALFSFFLAVPTLTGASALKSLGLVKNITSDEWQTILLGICLSFVFALLAIRYFIKLVSTNGFKYFGYYRIALGLFILVLYYRGHV